MSKHDKRAADDLADWICSVCGAEKPLDSMARECEAKHDKEHGKSSPHL